MEVVPRALAAESLGQRRHVLVRGQPGPCAAALGLLLVATDRQPLQHRPQHRQPAPEVRARLLLGGHRLRVVQQRGPPRNPSAGARLIAVALVVVVAAFVTVVVHATGKQVVAAAVDGHRPKVGRGENKVGEMEQVGKDQLGLGLGQPPRPGRVGQRPTHRRAVVRLQNEGIGLVPAS